MSRFAPIISINRFKEICDEKLNISDGGFYPYELLDLPKIQKDLSKINFDMENVAIGNADPNFTTYPSDCGPYGNYPVGYEVLPNDLPVLFVNAGGDWECPICFCIYYDGKTLRAYIPKNGNVYNVKEKCAYGNEYDINEEITEEITSDAGDPDLIRIDVMNRIQIK